MKQTFFSIFVKELVGFVSKITNFVYSNVKIRI